MTLLYCQTRTGGWATHRPTDTKKTRTGIPLYTLEEALALGYQPAEKPAPKPIPTPGQTLSLTIFDRPLRQQDGTLQIGTVVYQDGRSEAIGFNPLKPTTRVRTYRQVDENGVQAPDYTVRRIKQVNGEWVKVTYHNGKGTLSSPLDKIYHTKDLASQKQKQRDDWAEKRLGLFQVELEGLATGVKRVVGRNGKVRNVPTIDNEWLQGWFDCGIHVSEKYQELYALYREWRTRRFDGDSAAFEHLEVWAKQDRHLAYIQESHREHSVNRRNDTYRKLAYRYMREASAGGSITVSAKPKKVKGAKAKKIEKAGLTEDIASRAREIESLAASSTFVTYLVSACKRESVACVVFERDSSG